MPVPSPNPACRRPSVAATAVACLVGCLGAPASAETVLLSNGGMLSGRVEVLSDRVLVHSEGSTIRLEREAVVHVDASPLAVYDWRRGQLPGEHATADDHLRLAEWAMRHQMWPQAALELLEARRIAPGSARVAMYDRRLAELTRVRPPIEPLPADQTTVSEGASSTAHADPPLPPRLAGRFVRDVQPLLLNGCAAGGCHGVGVGSSPDVPMPLDRSGLHGRGASVATLRNLRSVLEAVDPSDPSESPLLVAARGPHAGVTPIDGRYREERLARIEAWAHAVAAELTTSPEVRQASAIAPAPRIETPPTEADATDEPRDEFDPEIFNRRFRTAEDDAPGEAS